MSKTLSKTARTSGPKKTSLPGWDLTDLYQGIDDKQIDKDLAAYRKAAESFAKKYKGKLASLDADQFLKMAQEAEKRSVLGSKLGIFAYLSMVTQMKNAEVMTFYQNISEKLNEYSKPTIFLPLELNRLPQAKIDEWLSDEKAAYYAPWLNRVRLFKDYELPEEVEEVLHEKSVTSGEGWERLYEETSARLKYTVDGKEYNDAEIAKLTDERHILVSKEGIQYHFGIDYMRDVWYESSYKLDCKQSGDTCAGNRFENYKMQPLEFRYPKNFTGKLADLGLSFDRQGKSGIRAAVIREKGCQCERETSYALYLAGFDVKDVHMTDLASGRETLEDVNMIVFCGGFSNSDVLGSAKGWAAGILFNEKAKKAIDNFYARKDTLSLGICNGCQLMAELGVIYPEHEQKHKMLHNDSHKFESNFVTLEIPKNHSVMFGSLSGCKIGAWVAHGEGKFGFPYEEKEYHIIAKYNYEGYPANPNGSPWSVAGVCSHDGRHLAMMPHLERAMFPWQCGYYPADRKSDEVAPWIEAFVNARKWIEATKH